MNQWNCEHCQGRIGPVPDLAGQTVACPYCLAPIAVPNQLTTTKTSRSKWKWLLAATTLLAITATIGLITQPALLPDHIFGNHLTKLTDRFLSPQHSLPALPDTNSRPQPSEPAITSLDSTLETHPSPNALTTKSSSDHSLPTERTTAVDDELTFPHDIRHPLTPDVVEAAVQHAVKDVVQTSLHAAVLQAMETSLQPAVHETMKNVVRDSVQQAIRHTYTTPTTHDANSLREPPLPNTIVTANLDAPQMIPTSTAPAIPARPGLAVRRDHLVHAIQELFGVEFYIQALPENETSAITTQISGAEVTLRGSPAEIETITIQGTFNDQNMAMLLATITSHVMPGWPVENAGDWFTKAVERCDNQTLVSTLHDGIEVAITAAGEGNFWIFLQADRD